jgi:hypothetical protein
MRNVHSSQSVQKFALHPLMHTLPPKTLAQDGGEGQNWAECA